MYQSSGPLRLRGRLQIEERGGDRWSSSLLAENDAPRSRNAGVAVDRRRRPRGARARPCCAKKRNTSSSDPVDARRHRPSLNTCPKARLLIQATRDDLDGDLGLEELDVVFSPRRPIFGCRL